MAWAPPTENDRSLVLRLQYGTVRVLLTGDIQQATERWLLTHRADLRADILQVPHHGSQTSTSPAFVQRVRPQVGIISLGAGNPYGHPHPRVLRVLAEQHVQVFRTDYHGAITITSDGTQYQVLPFRPYHPPALSAQGTAARRFPVE
jgi:competence protein ComEC